MRRGLLLLAMAAASCSSTQRRPLTPCELAELHARANRFNFEPEIARLARQHADQVCGREDPTAPR